MTDEADTAYMARALQLAWRGLTTTDPNPRVGCVLVRDGRVVGEGWHQWAGRGHAEVEALAAAGPQAQGATAYVTLEPCCHQGRTPPCTDALIKAGVRRVVAAMQDPNPRVADQGLARLERAGVATRLGLLEAQARALNPGFIKRMTAGRPWVRLKLAMSLDGRTALADGQSQWITGPDARRDVQGLRARSSAVLTGVGTVLADDPSLNVRLEATGPERPPRQPLRVILDPDGRTPATARTLELDGQVLVFAAPEADPERLAMLRQAGADVCNTPRDAAGLDLGRVLEELARRQTNEVHVECGATLAGSLLAKGLVDEVVIYMAPVLLGDTARGLFHLPHITTMDRRVSLVIDDIRAVGRDWRITARPVVEV